jgi:uncharacterized protein (TIGR03435 family)
MKRPHIHRSLDHRRLPTVAVVVLTAAAASTRAQEPAPSGPIRFEVASVKLSETEREPPQLSMSPSGLFVVRNMPVRQLITYAYLPLQGYQFKGMPDWTESTRVDVDARSSAGDSLRSMRPPSPVQLMVRSLLEERFAFRAHLETRQERIYGLIVSNRNGRLGPEIHPVTAACAAEILERERTDPSQRAQPRIGESRRPACGELRLGSTSLESGGSSMRDLAKMLSPRVGRHVVDATGLLGLFDFSLRFSPNLGSPGQLDVNGGIPPSPTAWPELPTALREQLGLTLDARIGPAEVLVIDQVTAPQLN